MPLQFPFKELKVLMSVHAQNITMNIYLCYVIDWKPFVDLPGLIPSVSGDKNLGYYAQRGGMNVDHFLMTSYF